MPNSIFRRNLSALSLCAADTAQKLSAYVPTNRRAYRLVPSQENVPTLLVEMEPGRILPLHHPNRPLVEVQSWLSGLPPEYFQNSNMLILGIGLAYPIHQFACHAGPETLITAVEPDMDLFATVLRQVDLSALFQSRNIHWLVGTTPRETARYLADGPERHRFAGQGIRILTLPGFQAYYSAYLAELAQEIQAALGEVQVRQRTVRTQAQLIFRNILENLSAVVQSPGVSELRAVGVGVPAFVVAPGPTLTEHLGRLREAGRKGYIIAVDTAARILRREGIPHHFVVSVDHTDLNRLHFDNVRENSAHLASYPGVHPSIPAWFGGRSFFFDHLGATDRPIRASSLLELLDLSDRLGSLVSLGSTTDCAYHLGRVMGCRPIVLIGTDLSFPGERFYAAGAMQEEVDLESPHTSAQYWVPNNRGGQVRTSHLYRMFCTNLGDLICSTGGLVYNTSLDGARISGTIPMPLTEILDHACDICPEIPSVKFNPDKRGTIRRIARIVDEISSDRNRLRRWEKEARRADTRDARRFQQRMIPVLKELAESLETCPGIRLAASQAEGSAAEILGHVHGIGLMGGTDSNANDKAKDQIVKWIREMREGMESIAPLLEKASQKLRET
ncbi:MAG TPA: DUF115 domain-containing protein [bacterium]|nr:DUF115 domain-containing protein [bacterium]